MENKMPLNDIRKRELAQKTQSDDSHDMSME